MRRGSCLRPTRDTIGQALISSRCRALWTERTSASAVLALAYDFRLDGPAAPVSPDRLKEERHDQSDDANDHQDYPSGLDVDSGDLGGNSPSEDRPDRDKKD